MDNDPIQCICSVSVLFTQAQRISLWHKFPRSYWIFQMAQILSIRISLITFLVIIFTWIQFVAFSYKKNPPDALLITSRSAWVLNPVTQSYWTLCNPLDCNPPGIDPHLQYMSPALLADSLPLTHQGKTCAIVIFNSIKTNSLTML